MTLEVFGFQFAMALTLFIALNWIGRHSESAGYITLSAFLRPDQAPAFNILFRLLGPLVFITLLASLLYWTGMDELVKDIWLVVAYYWLLRLLYIIGFARARLVNWKREVFLWIASIGGGWLLFVKVIALKENLLPDPKDLRNQFWILLILFLYTSLNNVRLAQDGTKLRKERYLRNEYESNKRRYGTEISSLAPDSLTESLVYAVLLHETFNRPFLARLVERAVFPWGSKTLGPMQVKTDRRISDRESVELGVRHVVDIVASAVEEGKKKAAARGGTSFDPIAMSPHRDFIVYKVASTYNKDDAYWDSIREMHGQVVDLFFPNLHFPTTHHSDYFFY